MNLEERKQGHGVGRAALSLAKAPRFLKESVLDIILMTRQQSDKRVEVGRARGFVQMSPL